MSSTVAKGYEQFTNLAAAISLNVPAGTSYAIITATGQAVRWRDDGTDPTSSLGYPLATNVELFYDAQLSRVRFIEQANGAILNVSYYGKEGV